MRIRAFAVVSLALFAVPLAAFAQDAGQPLTTGVPWVDKTIAILAAIGAICSLLSHVVSPDSMPGKVISWMALNFGKALKKQQPPATVSEIRPPPTGGYARVGLLAFLIVACVACGFIRKNFGPNIASDLLACETEQIKVLQGDLMPDLQEAFTQADWVAAVGALEAKAVSQLGSAALDALKCDAQKIVADYEAAHAQPDAGARPSVAMRALFSVADDKQVVYARALDYLDQKAAAK